MSHLTNKREEITAFAEWTAPSNIALIKYWGKREIQLPANASLSMALKESCTRTSVSAYKSKKGRGLSWDFYFEGKKNLSFEEKLDTFFTRVKAEIRLDTDLHLRIESENSFPHSAGIASSASSMAALSLCMVSLEESLNSLSYTEDEFFRKASRVSRLGSGSACRSVYGGFSIWGKNNRVKFSSDKYAIPFGKFHSLFNELHDTILIVDSGKKPVSSTTGHNLMNTHPFATARFAQADVNLLELMLAMEKGNWENFARIVETEALSLHSMMLTSSPWYILMKPASLEIIDRVVKFRKVIGVPVTFTLDAGPNIHLLYPLEAAEAVADFVKSDLAPFCEKNQVIPDRVGPGPKKLK